MPLRREGGVTYTLGAGETNINRHVDHVTETTTTTVTTENWLNSETYSSFRDTPAAIGQVHAALRDVLYGGLRRRYVDAEARRLPRGGDRKFGLWAIARAGRDSSDSDSGGSGSRRTTNGGSGGLSILLSDAAPLGVAGDYGKTDVALAGPAERGKARLTQIGLGADLSPEGWRIRVAMTLDGALIDKERGGGGNRWRFAQRLMTRRHGLPLAEAGPELPGTIYLYSRSSGSNEPKRSLAPSPSPAASHSKGKATAPHALPSRLRLRRTAATRR